ncbi:MAG: glycosyltransferase family 4 protein [Pseudomonadota bacterium]
MQATHSSPSIKADRTPERVRILALATDAFGGYGGIAQYNRDLLCAIAQNDQVERIDVKVRVGDQTSETPIDKLEQSKPVMSRLKYTMQALSSALRKRPTLILNLHLYHSSLSKMIAKITGAKLISQLHGTEIWGDVSERHLKALSASDLVLCVSRDTEEKLLQKAPALTGKTSILPNTVQDQFRVGDKQEARQKFGLGNEKVILTVARLDTRNGYKGHDKIISMLPELCEVHQGNLQYLIAGTGEDRRRLEALAQDLNVERHVKFLGRVDDEDLPDLYRAADVFAMPSTGEGFGIVYLEAMASGTPAIGLNVGGARDAFDDGQIGHCVSPEDFEATLKRVLSEPPPLPNELSQQVRARFGKDAFQAQVSTIMNLNTLAEAN